MQDGLRHPWPHCGRLEERHATSDIRRHGGGRLAVLAQRDGLRRRLQLLAPGRLLEVHAGHGGRAAGRDQGRDAKGVTARRRTDIGALCPLSPPTLTPPEAKWGQAMTDESLIIRRATPDDAAILAAHRACMFQDIGKIDGERAAAMIELLTPILRPLLASGEYSGWLAMTEERTIVAGAGVQIRTLLPRPETDVTREALVVNVY